MTAPPEQLAWRGGGKSNSSKFEMDAWHDNDRLYEVVRGLLEELGWAKEARARACAGGRPPKREGAGTRALDARARAPRCVHPSAAQRDL